MNIMSLAVIVDVKELANKDNPGTNKRKSFYMFLQMQYRTSAVEKMKVHPTMINFYSWKDWIIQGGGPKFWFYRQRNLQIIMSS